MRIGRKRLVTFVMLVANLPCSVVASNAGPPPRPQLVREALDKKRDLYYFGLGSNMLRSKLENRSLCGSKINVKSMEPATIKGHRLAFNMRGFPPLEPGMGSIEPVTDKDEKNPSKPLIKYKEGNECHGALVRLSSEDYEKVMRSEGVGNGNQNQGYEEVVVTAIPYNKLKRPVQAVALRAREHARMSFDPAPSLRYMKILRQGAEELGIKPCYRAYLDEHPVAMASPVARRIAVCNLVWTVLISFRLKLRFVSKIQSWMLWRVYAASTASWPIRTMSELATVLILLPGAVLGYLVLVYMRFTDKMSPMLASMVENHW